MSNDTQLGVQGITEADIANYLIQTPGFFERQAELLGSIRLSSPHGNRAVSLQERQMDMLRERIKGLEHRIMDMVRAGQDNLATTDRMHRWVRSVMLAATPALRLQVMEDELKQQFMVPQVALRVWGVNEGLAALPQCQAVGAEALAAAQALSQAQCGLALSSEWVKCLEQPGAVASAALVPLRPQGSTEVRAAWVLGSPDPTRYGPDMGTDLLQRLGELSAAALSVVWTTT